MRIPYRGQVRLGGRPLLVSLLVCACVFCLGLPPDGMALPGVRPVPVRPVPVRPVPLRSAPVRPVAPVDAIRPRMPGSRYRALPQPDALGAAPRLNLHELSVHESLAHESFAHESFAHEPYQHYPLEQFALEENRLSGVTTPFIRPPYRGNIFFVSLDKEFRYSVRSALGKSAHALLVVEAVNEIIQSASDGGSAEPAIMLHVDGMDGRTARSFQRSLEAKLDKPGRSWQVIVTSMAADTVQDLQNEKYDFKSGNVGQVHIIKNVDETVELRGTVTFPAMSPGLGLGLRLVFKIKLGLRKMAQVDIQLLLQTLIARLDNRLNAFAAARQLKRDLMASSWNFTEVNIECFKGFSTDSFLVILFRPAAYEPAHIS
ncbi:hypothetical protein ACFOLJ_10695 [Rugamonas sp. CCM 8940]|uniref:hypothetical protein n=1 Tax=Rugamonas sp. CCM 8940 TaxID=2765359 RepID=UPI0018F382B6|nr:hypothetical protein [Rugamonas sp. CCM 8940]MBJ7309783.1 hypothetical protein [Rugamonas sp. CCM 8940]